MPIYEYACAKCGHHLELLQKVGDPAPKRCPSCRKGKMEKMVSRTSFQLKGSGWYASDYAKKPAASTDSKSESKTESKTENKTEAKTESKTKKDKTTSNAA
jgi:putative FmdB family regulatory protein